MGYRYLAKSTSESSHEIPIEGFDLAEKDYRRMLSELEMFLNPERRREPPVIYAKVGAGLVWLIVMRYMYVQETRARDQGPM